MILKGIISTHTDCDREEIINKILELVKKLCITVDDKEEIIDYINYNEYGIAFEVLCSIIEQENITVSCDDFKIIEKLGMTMNFDRRLWNKICKSEN